MGAHVLSIPRERYLRDCCGGGPESLVALLAGAQPSPGGTVRATLRASGAAEAATPLCSLLRDMISGALPLVPQLHDYDSCRDENAEPVARNKCLAQCFHIVPDVYFLHLHTTAGVARIRTGPVDSGVGPSVNGSNARDAAAQYGRYNVCVCEPPGWAVPDGRGSCPRAPAPRWRRSTWCFLQKERNVCSFVRSLGQRGLISNRKESSLVGSGTPC